jgi:O-antigen/teichoic acid export membrane protein
MRLQKLIYQGIVWRGLYYASVFIINIVIARVYRAEFSGVFNYLLNNLSFLLLVTSVSLESSLAYFSSRQEISPHKLTGIAVLTSFFSAFVSAALIWLFVTRENKEIEPGFFIISFVYGLGVVFTSYFSSLFYSVQRVVFPNIILVVVNFAVLLVGWYYLELSPDRDSQRNLFLKLYLASFLVQGLILAFAWGFGQHGKKDMALPSAYEMKKLFNYAFAALLANIIFFLVYRVDYWFVKTFCDDVALGNYIQVSKLGQIFLLLPSIVATAVFTRTAGGNQEIVSVIEIISRWLLVLYALIVVAVALTGYWLFPAVYGPTFNQMYLPFLLLSPGILSLSTLSLLTAFYAGKNKLGVNIRGSMIALIVIVAGSFIFIPKYGINAAALVSSIGYICFQLYVLRQFKKEYHPNVLDFFIPKLSDWDRVKQFIRRHEDN